MKPIVHPPPPENNLELRNRYEILSSEVPLDSREIPLTEPSKAICVLKDGDGPLIRGRINEEPVSIFLDSGAGHNIVDYATIERISKTKYIKLEPETIKLKGITGNSLKVLGKVWLNIEFDNCTIQDYFIVTQESSFPGDVLISYNCMIRHRIHLFPDLWYVKIYGNIIPIISIKIGGVLYHSKGEYERYLNNSSNNPSDIRKCNRERITVERINEGFRQRINIRTPRPNRQKRRKLERKLRKRKHQKIKLQCHLQSENRPMSNEEINKNSVEVTVIRGHLASDARIYKKSYNKVTVEINVPENADVISMIDSCNTKGLMVESSIGTVKNGKIFVEVLSRLNHDIDLKKGSHIANFEYYSCPIKIINEDIGSTINAIQDSQEIDNNLLKNLTSQLHDLDFPEGKQGLMQLLQNYRNVISLPGESLGCTSLISHSIPLQEGTNPIYIPAYRLPHSQREVVTKLVDNMLGEGIIEPSFSPWNFPMVLVPKSDGTWRPCIDFRRLNAVTIPDRYPIPVMGDLLQSLGNGNKIFSKIDLAQGFWQIPMDDNSKELTAFSTPDGHYQFRRMPMGLRSSPFTFSRLMNNIFSGLIGKSMFCYMDDIIIMSKDLNEHFDRLESVLKRLQESGLKIKIKKCSFLKRELKFLGHIVNGDGIATSKSKIEAVKDFPIPRNSTQVRSFLGLAGYYRSYIRNFATKASPLTNLLKKDMPFEWNDEQQSAFDLLKEALISTPVLKFPDFTKSFILATDASNVGLGAVLMQKFENKLHPIAYASRTLNKAERNYSTTDKECLAVVYALKHFRDLIYGYQVHVLTDHGAVTEIFKDRNLRGKLARWFLTIQEFNPTFEYLPGRLNNAADALSRNIANMSAVTVEFTPLDLYEVAVAQENDSTWGPILKYLKGNKQDNIPDSPVPLKELILKKNVLFRETRLSFKDCPNRIVHQLIIPQCLINEILKLVHDVPHSAHPGKDRTLRQARLNYYWTTMRADIYSHVEKCHSCATFKGNVQAPAPILSYPIAELPWDRVSIDLMTNFPTTANGNKHLLVCVDQFSRFCELIPIPDKTAETVATAFKDRVIAQHTSPKILISDQGGEFINNILDNLCKMYKIKKVNITSHHPASNGLVERQNKKILDCLRHVIDSSETEWDRFIADVQSALNGSINSSIGDTPHFILYGVDKRLPYDLLLDEIRPLYNYDDFVQVRFRQSQSIFRKVKRQLEESTEKMIAQQHKRAGNLKIEVGSLVYVQVHENQSLFKKLAEKFEGPYRVISPESGNKWRLKSLITGKEKVAHIDHLKTVKDSNFVRSFPEEKTEIRNGDELNNLQHDNVQDIAQTSDRVLRSHKNKQVIAYCDVNENGDINEENINDDYINRLLAEFDDVDINLQGFYT